MELNNAKEIRLKIANTLKDLRLTQNKYSCDQVGEIIGRKGKTVNAWENNRGQPDIETFFFLCQLYEVKSIDETFGLSISNIMEVQESFEDKLIKAYNDYPEMQSAVNRLLRLDDER